MVPKEIEDLQRIVEEGVKSGKWEHITQIGPVHGLNRQIFQVNHKRPEDYCALVFNSEIR